MTKQRALLLSIFRSEACFGRHRTAEEILELAKAEMPGISRATVYNNLRSMENEGLIRKISGEGGADFYDSSFVLHGHLFCTECGEIKDIDPNLSLEFLSDISGSVVTSYELKVRHVCEKCRKNREKTAEE
jgi:Fe2+ or Zn2+ uptake regulation protein